MAETPEDPGPTRQGPLFQLSLAESQRLARNAVEHDLAEAVAHGRIPDTDSGPVAILRDVADRLDMLRFDPSPKAAYAVVAITRTLQDLYALIGVSAADEGKDALDRLIEAFEDDRRIP